MKKAKLSLVVPAFKQENVIISDLKNLSGTLSKLPLEYEILVVVDGFLDKTFERAKSLENENIKVMGYEQNVGKGFAIKYGVKHATGDIVGFIDAGMDIDPSEISLMLDIMEFSDADIVVGSKLHPQSIVNYPIVRKILSGGYRTITHLLFGFTVNDTQVGLKLFKKKVAKEVFERIVVKRFAFDVEVLAVAYKLGYIKIYEAPIKLNFTGASTITSTSFWDIIFWMLYDTLAVFYRLKILHYYDRK